MSLLNLTDDQLSMLEDMGSVFFTHKQCAIVLQVPIDVLQSEMLDDHSAAYQAYERGRLQTLLEVRKNAVAMARNGSSPAQNLIEKMLSDYEFNKAAQD